MNTFMYKGRECYIVKVYRKRVVLAVVGDDSLVIIAAPQTIIKNLSIVDSMKFNRELRRNKRQLKIRS